MPGQSRPPNYCRLIAGALAVCLGLATPVAGQLRDSFEGPQPTWTLKEADCGVRVLAHERTYRAARGGQASEYLRLGIGTGTFVHVAQPVGRAPIIPEFQPSLFVKSDRPNVQLMARVVFPRSLDRGTGQPLASLIRGDSYTDVGNWQQLSIREISKLLTLETAVLRRQFGSEVDPREAYVDLIVVNAYSAPGNIDLWLDDLEIQGYVNLDEAAGPQIARRASPDPAPGSAEAGQAVVLQGSQLLVRGRPIAPRIIEHRGEPLAWLQTLGFQAVKLNASPSPQELAEARRLGLWLVAPPPYGDETIAVESFGPVLAWSLGSRLTERDLDATRDLAGEVRRFEPHEGRPLVCSADSGLAELSRTASLLVLERPTLGTTSELAYLRRWLLARPRLARPGIPVWGTVFSQRSERLAEQLVLLGEGTAPEEDIDPDQLRLQAFAALAAGARGLTFPAPQPLAIDNLSAALRTDALKLLNLELKLYEPWVAAGNFAEELAAGDNTVQVSVLQTERSRLLLLTQHAPAQQYVLGPPPRGSIAITIPGVSVADRAYGVSLGGIKQLRVSHASTGAKLTIEDAGHVMAVVVTQDPLAMHHLNRTLAEIRPEAARLRYDIAVRRYGRTVEIDRELAAAGHALAAAGGWLSAAGGHLEQARRLLEANDFDNLHAAVAKAEADIAKVRRGHWEQTAAAFPSPAASPCLSQFTTLPLHWQLAGRLGKSQWTGNVQVAGDMESLDQMLAAGWRQQRAAPPGVGTDVSLSLQSPRGGRSSLRMQAWAATRGAPAIVERPLVWITSSPVPARQGQIARIHGWASVPRLLAGGDDGLLIFDSQSGSDLGERIRQTQGWREFTFYRAIPQNGDLTVTFALTAYGEASLDDLSITLLEPEPLRPR
ncbi:MAG: hypothetical protein SFU86_18740 [Pirellulaceae bacterium]|nr:hypothetical protein [Pirellulaceae bacterium]